MDISRLKIVSRAQEKYIIGLTLLDQEELEMLENEIDDWRRSAQIEELTRQENDLKGLLARWTGDIEPTLVFGRFHEVLGLGDEKGNIILAADSLLN